ncbi:MAG: hypothetical protein Q6373_004030 [Candidatus Sigynarchaeota archaeon]
MSQFFTYDYQWMAYVGAIASSVTALVVLALLARKYAERKAVTVRSLRNMAAFLMLAAVIDYVTFTINALYPGWRLAFDYVRLGSYMSFTANAIANIYLLLFIRDVFFDGKAKVSIKLLAGLEAAVGPALVAIFFTDDPDLPLLALAVHVASALVIYTILSANAFRLRGRIKSDASRQVEAHGLAFIGISGLVMFAAVILFVAHEVIIIVPIREYWTVTLGWLLGAFGGVIVYLGFTPPESLKNRWAKQVPKGKANSARKKPDKQYT